MHEEAILACLQRIEEQLASDEYESGGIYTVGGPAGSYIIRSPFNTECEWTPYGIFTTPNPASVVGEATRTVLNLASAARATYTAQQFAVGDLTSLKCIFNETAITGGTTPTVTFKVSSVGADGTVVQLEQAAAASGAFVFDYNIGPGTDGKEFGNLIQVDMITTGAPTSVTFSASILGKGPVTTPVGNGIVAISAGDPTAVPANPTVGLATGGQDNNAFPGVIVPISYAQNMEFTENWQPLGRGLDLFITASPATGLAYVSIAFQRKLNRNIPTPPRRQPHTHSHVGSRRGDRTFMAGFEAQYPHDKYIHEPIPVTDDPAAIGNVENLTPAQKVLRKLRNGGH